MTAGVKFGATRGRINDDRIHLGGGGGFPFLHSDDVI